MIYIENIFLCIAVPMLLSLPFFGRRQRSMTLFILLGMGMCLLSAYVNSFFMAYFDVSPRSAAVEITTVCEEILKLLPTLLYYLIFEPDKRELPQGAIAVSMGFATFENICFLTENGARDIFYMLIRGISAGALHILCGVIIGYGIAYVFQRRYLALTGSMGLLGACIVFHAIFNLLITAGGVWKSAGCFFPAALLLCLYAVRRILPRFLPRQ